MRRLLLGGLVAATMIVPSLALASPVRQTEGQIREATPGSQQARLNQVNRINSPANGAGQMEGNVPGQVTGPGYPQINTDIQRPINDVQPGQGTNDTPQNKNPPPAR